MARTFLCYQMGNRRNFYRASNASDKSIHWSANPEWLANNTATSEKGRSLLLSFINDIDGCIDNTLSKLKNGYQIDAFLWHQGESDHAHGDKYYENLKAVVTYVTQPSKRKNRKGLLHYLHFRYGSQEEQTVWQRSGSRHETFLPKKIRTHI